MDIKPNIRKGFGPMTTRGWNKIANKANERSPANDARARKSNASGSSGDLAIVLSYTSIGNRRWKYIVSLCKFNLTTQLFEEINASVLTLDAYNTIESLQSIDNLYDGPGIVDADIPSGYSLLPIMENTVVIVTKINGVYFFCVPNPIDGSCPA